MNRIIIKGRLTKDPDVRMTPEGLQIARYTLAVDRPKRQGQDAKADFFTCTAFRKQAEFSEKYMKKGAMFLITGSMQQDNYVGKDGQKVFAWQVIVDEQEFCEGKTQAPAPELKDFMGIPDDFGQEELPFNF